MIVALVVAVSVVSVVVAVSVVSVVVAALLLLSVRPPLPPPRPAGRVLAVFDPPPARHSWGNIDCAYSNLKPDDKPVCTCAEPPP